LHRVKSLEAELGAEEVPVVTPVSNETMKGTLKLNGPLPADFSERFAQVAARTADCDPAQITVLQASAVDASGDYVEMTFEAPKKVTKSLEDQAADPESKLATSPLRPFLVEREGPPSFALAKAPEAPAEATEEDEGPGDSPSEASPAIDIDTAMPYGELEPFGREDTAQELTEESVKDSNDMVDQLERAEVAEEKRAVFRALTRLRGAAITSFDGIARSQTGQIDEYNKVHKWRKTHPLHHLADEESDVAKWAFPDAADF